MAIIFTPVSLNMKCANYKKEIISCYQIVHEGGPCPQNFWVDLHDFAS